MPRHFVTLTTDIVIDFPDNMELNPELPEVQAYLKEEFLDYLESAKEYITWSFEINSNEAEEYE